ncbi:MAG: hypothetical protein U9R38_01375, partial [Candidatus Margulisiibacteriota bacterium]|nr:hypothetical protein [Candidatus Margulisiibacteriota bacterium]
KVDGWRKDSSSAQAIKGTGSGLKREGNKVRFAMKVHTLLDTNTKNYKDKFNNETSLLAAAGILDALVYIFMDQTINLQEIIDIAQKSVSSKEEALIDFIIKLEVKLFKVDTPDMDISEIENACIGQKKVIVKAIQKTKEEYTSEPRFASDVANFMDSAKFKPYRKMLGIKDKFLFF